MYKGEHIRFRKKTHRKESFALLVSAIILTLGIAGGTIAYLVDHDEPVINSFQPEKVSCEVTEQFEDNVKTDVAIKNTGTTDAFIRAKVVATWQDQDGNISAQPVKETDYIIEYNNNGWFQKDGYWYCKTKIAFDTPTPILIEKCTVDSTKAPDSCHLVVEILADAIQANPDKAVNKAWGVTASNGTLTE